jgi:hypothetical protein
VNASVSLRHGLLDKGLLGGGMEDAVRWYAKQMQTRIENSGDGLLYAVDQPNTDSCVRWKSGEVEWVRADYNNAS